MEFLQIVAFMLLIAGAVLVFGARKIVRKYGLDRKAKCNFEHEMTEEELENYKINKAVVNTKMLGMLVALPGIVLILVLFK